MGDKSGSSALAIALPKGGGALRGLGETFSPDLHTGTGNFSVPIALPPGRNGLQPRLRLAYSTGNGNGPFGLGWRLSVPGVSRKTSRGVPRYDDAVDTFILSGSEDVVPILGAPAGATRYRPRSEGLFARIDHHRGAGGDYWEIASRDGLVSRYGVARPVDTPADWRDPAVVADPFSEAMKRVSAQVLAVVCSRHRHADREIPLRFIRDGGIDNPGQPLGIMYHRDQNPSWEPGAWPKSCPGLQISHDNLDPDLLQLARQHSPWQWADGGGGGGGGGAADPVAEAGSFVAVRGATVRRRPSREGEEVGRLTEGRRYPTDAYTDRGEAVEDSSRWYRLAIDATWVHSSGGAYTTEA